MSLISYLLHGHEQVVHCDAGYIGAESHADRADVEWVIAKRRSAVQEIENARERARAIAAERRKASIRAFVEHPFRIVKCVFGYRKVRFKGLAKNTAQVLTLFALANLYLARRRLMEPTGNVRPQFG